MYSNKRVRVLNDNSNPPGATVYWMSRDQRLKDNWALIAAQEFALQRKAGLHIIFNLVPDFLEATARQYEFMLTGLQELEKAAISKSIPFTVLKGDPVQNIPKYLKNIKAGALFSDFDPLRIKRQWKNDLVKELTIPVFEVDAHNIIPCWITSDKKEYAAYTIRPKIQRNLAEFLTDIPALKKHPHNKNVKAVNNWQQLRASLKIDQTVEAVDWLKPGEKAAGQILNQFIKYKLSNYDEQRNDPLSEMTSNLSPYLHFGQISAQRVAHEIRQSDHFQKDKDAFLEELIVRRELSDNYCYYEPEYDSLKNIPDWAKQTLKEHKKDKRPYLYELKQLENADTHDKLWNAAQLQMVKTGKMHGYLRMYWAKKILEWTSTSEQALQQALYLNDKYELDGRDPNGYAGVAWSIGGIHDRAWPQRPVFGKIRYMNDKGCRRKFDVDRYIEKISDL